ncbi:MAG: polyprenol monophosphomannose synthase [Acidimicrobiaceae bacterium]|nr:polyprenol monophosphomannose synthase [Acidimicrobiaceae bacterium]
MTSVPSSNPWVVIPTYQEAENIETIVLRVLASTPQATVLVVDDSSPDGTAAIAKQMSSSGLTIRVMVRPEKSGLGSAYREGFAQAVLEGASAIIEIDADLSHDPAAIPSLLSELDSGADLAIGSRYVPGGTSPGLPFLRLLISKGGNLYAGFILGLPVRDATSGFRAYRAEMMGRIDLSKVRADGYGFQVEMAYRIFQLGGTIKEIPIEFRNRAAGASKMSIRIVVEAMALCTVWGAARKIPWLAEERRQEKVLDLIARSASIAEQGIRSLTERK